MPAHHQRRWQPLLEQWVVIAAASQARPWSGARVGASTEHVPEHDEQCYLCPRVQRASGESNPDYHGPWAFDNDYASLQMLEQVSDQPAHNDNPLRKTAAASGRCRVLCWNERHDKTLANLSIAEMSQVAALWQSEYRLLSSDPAIKQVLIFENKGAEVGVSNRHPHGQVYATGFVTDTAIRMRHSQQHYAKAHGGHMLLQDLVAREEYQEELLVEQTRYFKTVVPFAARMPYESWIVPRRAVTSIAQLTDHELDDLAAVYQRQAKRYDNLFQRLSPNITLLHNAPTDGDPANQHWCFHIAMQPPLRDSDTLKYLAGFEAGSNNIVNPVQPEVAAAAMRLAS